VTSPGISAHSALAPYYADRTPYFEPFFADLAARLQLNTQSTLLDVCCGRGELAAGLAQHAGRIYAIDGSPEMLVHALARDHVTYALCDVNAETYHAGTSIDHFVVGRAMHHIEVPGLAKLIEANLREGGTVVSCSSYLGRSEPWQAALNDVLIRFGQRPGPGADIVGAPKFRELGFEVVDDLQINFRGKIDAMYLARHERSRSYGELFTNVSSNFDRFAEDLSESLSPYMVEGLLDATIINWAYLFRRT
jgi:SAM-dependent methyltransferase